MDDEPRSPYAVPVDELDRSRIPTSEQLVTQPVVGPWALGAGAVGLVPFGDGATGGDADGD